MKRSLILRILAIALAIVSTPLFSIVAQSQEKVAGSGEVRVPKLQSEAEFQKLMPITGEVETYFGDFQLDHSYPTKESADRIYELMDHQRASQLYLWGLPLVAMERLHQNYWENFDYAYNTFIKIETFNERRGYLTANETTNYALSNFNTRGGAVVLDLPPGQIVTPSNRSRIAVASRISTKYSNEKSLFDSRRRLSKMSSASACRFCCAASSSSSPCDGFSFKASAHGSSEWRSMRTDFLRESMSPPKERTRRRAWGHGW